MSDFTVNGKKYKSSTIDALAQFAMLRRMGPLFPALLGAKEVWKEDRIMGLSYALNALARLSDADANYIITTCLGSCQLLQGEKFWADVYKNGSLMFKDILLPDLMELTWLVLRDNYEPFIPALSERFSLAPVAA